VATAAMADLLGGGLPLSQIMPGQVRLSDRELMRPTPMVVPKARGKGR
jgi:hypothetical protein